MKRWISLLLCLCMMMTLCPAFAEGETGAEKAAHQIVEKTVPFYQTPDDSTEMTLYFVDGEDGIPWVDLATWAPEILNLYQVNGDPGMELTAEADGEIVALTRENGAVMTANFEDDTIAFNDYNCFISASFAASIMDAATLDDTDAEGRPYVFQRQPRKSYDRPGGEKVYDLASYGIHLIHQDGKYLIPMNTIVDIAVSPKDGISLNYNGLGVFPLFDGWIGSPDNLTPLGELYCSAEPRDRTEAECEYGYNELCLLMDNFYGLKALHQISSFDELFQNLGIVDELKSPDAGLADIALAATIQLYIDDSHSGYTLLSWMAPKESDHAILRDDRNLTKRINFKEAYTAARQEYYPDDVPGYEEVGNTAFITFDSFNEPLYAAMQIYDVPEDQMEQYAPMDTMALISYAHRQITRENSPIENVVIDLSCNGGGQIDAAIFIIAWFLGEADIAYQDRNTGALSATVYKADINLDREFDEKDLLTGKNLYCLISPVSFSCGNLVPAAFKSSQKVTLIGQQSGGGTCVIAKASTAWGGMFSMSSCRNLSVFKNGSMYDIDQGIEPDYYLGKFSSFYDRAKLAKIINDMD